METKTTESTKASLMPFHELVQASWETYREHARAIVGMYLTPALGVVVVGVVAGLIILFGWLATRVLHLPSYVFMTVLILIGSLAFLVAMYVSYLSQAAFIMAIDGRPKPWKELLHAAVPRVGAYFRSGFLVGLGVGIGFVLFIVPGVLCAVWYGMAPFIAIHEKVSAGKSLALSKSYVKGRAWKVLGYYALLYIITIGLTSVASWVTAWPHLEVVSAALQLVIVLLWTPFAYIFIYKLYRSLKASA